MLLASSIEGLEKVLDQFWKLKTALLSVAIMCSFFFSFFFSLSLSLSLSFCKLYEEQDEVLQVGDCFLRVFCNNSSCVGSSHHGSVVLGSFVDPEWMACLCISFSWQTGENKL